MNHRRKLWRRRAYGTPLAGHVVLLGDSILDNEHYVGRNPDVSRVLAGVLGDQWKVTLLARDGATTGTLQFQAAQIPADTTELFVSIGGNDANRNSRILREVTLYTMKDALEEMWFMGELFALDYAEAMEPLLKLDVPLTVCTIYDCDFGDGEAEAVKAALAIFNDVILRFAFLHNLPVLDLRTVCTKPEDYVMYIEPSATGGAKIARAISERLVPAGRHMKGIMQPGR